MDGGDQSSQDRWRKPTRRVKWREVSRVHKSRRDYDNFVKPRMKKKAAKEFLEEVPEGVLQLKGVFWTEVEDYIVSWEAERLGKGAE